VASGDKKFFSVTIGFVCFYYFFLFFSCLMMTVVPERRMALRDDLVRLFGKLRFGETALN